MMEIMRIKKKKLSYVWLDKVWKTALMLMVVPSLDTHPRAEPLSQTWLGWAAPSPAGSPSPDCRTPQPTQTPPMAGNNSKKESCFLLTHRLSGPSPHYPGPLTGLQSLRPVVSEWFIPRQIKFSCARLACNDLSCSARGWRRGNGTTEEGVD